MIAPAIEGRRHCVAPTLRKPRAWFSGQNCVAQRCLTAKVALAAGDKRTGAQRVRKTADKNRIDIGIDSTVPDQHTQPDKIRVVRIAINAGDAAVIFMRLNFRSRYRVSDHNVVLEPVPPHPPGPRGTVDHHLLWPVHLDAGADAEKVEQGKWLRLRPESVHKVEDAGNHARLIVLLVRTSLEPSAQDELPMADNLVIDPHTILHMVGQLAPLMVSNKWVLGPPPANMMRGVDFYNATDLISALVYSAQRFKNTHGYLPHLASPTSFNEHIFARKFFAPFPMPSLADKLYARNRVRNRLGDDALTPVVWIGNRIEDLYAANLPAGRFVLKANHGCFMNLFLDLPQDLATRRNEIQAKTREWLDSRFGYNTGEWHYSTFKPTLFLEAFNSQGDNQPMDDFKVHCFYGKARLINVVTGRFVKVRLGQYAPDWTHLPTGMRDYDSAEFPRPENLAALIAGAERIAEGLEYARIDLYSDRVQAMKFGEITLTPGNANQRYADFEFDRWLGGFFAPPG